MINTKLIDIKNINKSIRSILTEQYKDIITSYGCQGFIYEDGLYIEEDRAVVTYDSFEDFLRCSDGSKFISLSCEPIKSKISIIKEIGMSRFNMPKELANKVASHIITVLNSDDTLPYFNCRKYLDTVCSEGNFYYVFKAYCPKHNSCYVEYGDYLNQVIDDELMNNVLDEIEITGDELFDQILKDKYPELFTQQVGELIS